MIHLAAGTATLGLVYVFMSVAYSAGLLISPVIGGLAYVYWRLLDPDEVGARGHLRAVATATVGPGLGLIVVWLTPGLSLLPEAAGVVIAGLVALAIYSWKAQSGSVPCVLCQQSAGGAQGVHCPRCGDRVCVRTTCWNARYFRCVRCHERGVPLPLPLGEQWWAARLGRRVMKGECLSCYMDATETDLRECGQCHWPMCRRCWDYHNGRCQRCEWTMPDLPRVLAPFLQAARPRSNRGRRRGASSSDQPGKRRHDEAPPSRPARTDRGDPSDETVKQPPR